MNTAVDESLNMPPTNGILAKAIPRSLSDIRVLLARRLSYPTRNVVPPAGVVFSVNCENFKYAIAFIILV